MMRYGMIFLATLVPLSPTYGGEKEAEIQYPEGYRSWYHVKTMILEEGHPLYESFGGIHHIYANPKALQGYKKGKFPDGSVIVFDLLNLIAEKGAMVEGQRKVLAVMVKDSKRFKETGGWGFQAFKGGDPKGPIVKDAKRSCFACHASQKDKDYVFSKVRE